MKLMSKAKQLPNLTFPVVEYGEYETAWDLTYLLYHGGAQERTKYVSSMIEDGKLGLPVSDRLDLVTKIHEIINGKLVGGGSTYSAKNQIRFIREMFQWAEQTDHPLSVAFIQTTFLAWTDALLHRQRILKDISEQSVYTMAAHAGNILDGVLNRATGLLSMSRVRMPSRRKTARGVWADKQNLAETFAFGYFLQDICDALTVETVMRGTLPVRIAFRNGGELLHWSGFRGWKEAAQHSEMLSNERDQKAHDRLRTWEAEGTLLTRYPLANRRCEAELLMFIGQTGMNFAQAHQLKLRHFYYASFLDGYQVRHRKGRRGGDVVFEIFKEYKPHFERYLEWRRMVFPDSDALFPLVRAGGRVFQQHPQFGLRTVCKTIGLRFVPPQELRNTRVNWLLRRSDDSDLTATMAQHTKETLLDVYERPSQQRAMVEIMRFWGEHDPTISRTTPPAPGHCNGEPVPLRNMPTNTLEPDCIRPSGCLWCEHHRDVDNEDYLWSLASFRRLKVLEVSRWWPPHGTRDVHPAQHVIDRISEKLKWFRESNAKRKVWMEEALNKVEEGNYHPEWMRRILVIEGVQ